MKIVFTRHALKKFRDLAIVGVKLSQVDVTTTVKSPEHVDKESDYPNVIVSKSIDLKHVLRVVFKAENDIITIITFYPSRKGRYYEKKAKKH